MKFRKKPVVVEAHQWNPGEKPTNAPDWLWKRLAAKPENFDGTATLFIDTLEGRMECKPGDWIIQGVKGELYPCKPDIFAATYEAAEASPAREAATPDQSGVEFRLNRELHELDATARELLTEARRQVAELKTTHEEDLTTLARIGSLWERVGVIADRADNFVNAARLPMPDSVHKVQLESAMVSLRDELRKVVVEAMGRNPWEE